MNPQVQQSGVPRPPSREDKMYSQGREDPYQSRKKIADPTRCPTCKAVYLKGRWTWETVADPVNEDLCPACKRIKERVHAGVVQISGPFFDEHREEIENLIKNAEKLEKERHPMERLMAMENSDGLRVLTTGIHLPRRIGDALHDAYQGDLEVEYLEDEYKVRVTWQR